MRTKEPMQNKKTQQEDAKEGDPQGNVDTI